MGLKGYTFDRMKISPKADALLYHSMLDGNDRIVKGYKDELKVVATGLNTYVSPGACVVQGRMIEIDEEMQLSVSANDTGYVCIVIDLTQNNTSTGEAGTPEYQPVNNQLRLEVVKELVQQDLHNGGQLYTFPLASFTSTGTTVALTKINHNQRIVESGSNANGSWTKFADGTMICHQNTAVAGINIPVNGEHRQGLTFPQPFVGKVTTHVDGIATTDANTLLYIPLMSIAANNQFPGGWMIGFKNTSNQIVTKINGLELTAFGRWK